MSTNSRRRNEDSGTQSYLRFAAGLIALPANTQGAKKKKNKDASIIPMPVVVEEAVHTATPPPIGAENDEMNGSLTTPESTAEPAERKADEFKSDGGSAEAVNKANRWDVIERHKRTLGEIAALPQINEAEPDKEKKKHDKKRLRRDREIVAFGVVLHVPRKLAEETKRIVDAAPFGRIFKIALQRVATIQGDKEFAKAFRKLKPIFAFIRRELPKPTKKMFKDAAGQLFLPLGPENAK